MIDLVTFDVDKRKGEGLGRSEQILVEELPALAREVARVETVRVYAGEFIFCFIFTNVWIFIYSG